MADDEFDALFAVVPGEFTAARDALVKRLRAAGEREAAKTVAGLRRPKLAAWAMNRLVRTDRAAVEALLEAGVAVRDQQRRLLSGAKAPQLQAASAARRSAIEELVAEAVDLSEQQGMSARAHVDEITATLEAASANEEAGRQVLAARLSSPLAPPTGFGDLSALSLVGDVEERSEPAARHAPEEAEGQSQAPKRRRQAEDALKDHRAAADDAEAARTRAHDEVRAATREAEAARQAAEDADAAAVAARRDADRLLHAAEEAGTHADRARAALEVIEKRAAATQRRAEEAERALQRLD